MADIDYNTCSMDDVIARSLLLHPSLFADRLYEVAAIHRRAVATMSAYDTEARRIAAEMAATASAMALAAVNETMVPAELTFSGRIIAFTAAARLNCLSPALTVAIATREVQS